MDTKLRTHTCNELRASNTNNKVRLSGWVAKRRDHGGVIFIDLRDRYGITQLVFEPECKAFAAAEKLGREFCIHIVGVVKKRKPGMENNTLDTGAIEVYVDSLEILNKSDVPPFEVDERTEVSEDVRLKYRYLDLRKPKMSNNLVFRGKVIKFIRDWMYNAGFLEIETPILTSSSPEGARDFIVPSRVHPGKFYALPQAPQQYKQLLMVGGMDKYFQIAPCMRDEDPRADRSPGEFYQLDIETSFLSQDEFFELMEPLLIELSKKFTTKKIFKVPFPKLAYKETMLKYGTDKPDMRFGLEIQDVSSLLKDTTFEVFKRALKDNGSIRVIVATGAADKLSRADLDELTKLAESLGAKGLAYISLKDDEIKSPLIKFLGKDMIDTIIEKVSAKKGDIIFFMADSDKKISVIMGELRLVLGNKLNLINRELLCWAWIVDFPMFEFDELSRKIVFGHNPFSMPQGGLKALESKNPLDILAFQYDIVCNGLELSSGAVRNNIPEVMYKAFEITGYTKKEVDDKFRALINAFRYGAPPHCGFAPGIERLVMLLRDEVNIREVTAFPKNKAAEDVMMGAPSEVSDIQLKELHIKCDMIKKSERASLPKK
ncbi:MAG: aspartate--tRNA ligase [Nanoarchaeota archaeon]